MSLSKRIIAVVMEQMPEGARCFVTETELSGAVLSICWKLKIDPKRPNKWSKTIVVFLTRELLEDFPDYPEPMQENALKEIANGIRNRLKTFDPDHDAPRYQQPPVENWTITTEEIFG